MLPHGSTGRLIDIAMSIPTARNFLRLARFARARTFSRVVITSVALGFSLALPLLQFLPASFADPLSRRPLLALLLAGILSCFMLEKCGAHRRLEQGTPAARSRVATGALVVLSMLVVCADSVLIGVIAHVQPVAGALVALLRLAHDARYGAAYIILVPAILAGTTGLLTSVQPTGWLSTALVLASAKMLYVGVGEMVPYLHGSTQLPLIHQAILVAFGVAACAIVPGMGKVW